MVKYNHRKSGYVEVLLMLVSAKVYGREVEFDDTEFKVMTNREGSYLKYIGDGKNVKNPSGNISCRNMFSNYKGTLDLSAFDTSEVIDMTCMFQWYCGGELDLGNFNTENVVDMSCMFEGCDIEVLDLSMFDTSSIKCMSYMFSMCYSLEDVYLDSFNTKNVDSMERMFDGCKALTDLDLSSFVISTDLDDVVDLSCMFKDCISLESINITEFNVSNALVANMFFNCDNLYLDLSKFRYNSIDTVYKLIHGCSNVSVEDTSILVNRVIRV